MDEVSKEQIVKENDRKISFRLYDSEESPSPWLIISGNNNNNADAKLTEHLATQNTEKEENCCTNFEYFPMQKKKNLRDQQQAHNKIDDVANEMPDDLGAKAEQETMDPINKENGLKANENDASTDDDNNNDNNDNSFENLSYISEDENLGVIDDIILLPNNLYSEDEMSNSDDCIYAYRGIDFEPIRSSPEDENDFLEMDFEPDPSSEIEQDNNATKELDCAVNSVAITSNLPNHDQLEIAVADVKIKPNNTCNRSDSPSNSDRDFENRSGGNVLGGNSTTESKCMCAENNGESCCCLTRLKSASEGFNGERDSTAAVETHFQGEHLMELTQPHSSQQASNVILSAPLSMKKYTGTIPKTNRNYLHFRSGRPKVPNTTLGTAKIYREMTDKNYPSYMCKRWKNANSALDAPNYQKCDESQNALHTFPDPVKTKSNTKRSMSFPFEGFIQSEQRESNNETQVVPTCSQVMAKLQSSQSQNHLFNHDKLGADATNCNGHCHTRGLITNDAVTIFTGNCNVDIIAAALGELNIHVNLRKLTACLAHINDIELMRMSISDYLIHMSKQNCDFKAIRNAILSSHDDVELHIEFIPTDMDNLDDIQIPVKEILLRLRQNSNLFDILSIRNKRFQRSNVLGQVANAIRKFRNKHLDSLKDNYITVPQYYRSGYLSISKK